MPRKSDEAKEALDFARFMDEIGNATQKSLPELFGTEASLHNLYDAIEDMKASIPKRKLRRKFSDHCPKALARTLSEQSERLGYVAVAQILKKNGVAMSDRLVRETVQKYRESELPPEEKLNTLQEEAMELAFERRNGGKSLAETR